ncbi:MAG: dihydropteroate synthase-like protein, partial [Candidatus Methanomethylicota archaeon]
SIDLSNLEKVHEQVKDRLCIAIPADISKGFVPPSPEDRVKLLSSLIDRAKKLGIERLMADPILDAAINPGFTKSLSAFHAFHVYRRDVPLFMGVGNVVELLDADSVGINALLAMAALEVGATMLLTVEKSNKAKGSTLECSLAARMASIAYVRRMPPKALGIDLLVLKEKKLYEMPLLVEEAEIVEAVESPCQKGVDLLGSFKISVDHREGVIKALYIGKLGVKLIKGRTAKAVLDAILNLGLVSTTSHAAYLGVELSKAEIALMLRRTYLQEEQLFQDKRKLLKEVKL